MRLRPEQLAAHLRKTLAPIYLVFGEEPLQAQESADAIRAAARARGYGERECLTVDTGFDWNALGQLAASPVLFSSQRLLELRMGNAKPGDAGAQVLSDYATRPAADAVLLISAGKLDWNTQKGRWFAALEAAGVVVQAAPIDGQQLPVWIERRLRERGFNPQPDAVALLAERVEGNLLAAAQEVDMLALLATERHLTADAVWAVVGDSSRFTLYDWVDAALAGQPERVARTLAGLRHEGIEPVLLNWALHQEVRRLVMLAFARSQGQSLDAALSGQVVWEKRKVLLRQVVQRLSLDDCQTLLRTCSDTDRIIKGAEAGSAWESLLANSLRLAGVELLPA